ncbi:THAP domain-containing protein 2 [Chionoecetes opilio]|uniref:THAP domain-containing protein 2 n=1 Tax=Chionoecetes opilio TaxID=41210 RepID=A0A8J4XRI6_CHIOP|nr:THAP domain-containing protein 2 [Chionoecetes opilio]
MTSQATPPDTVVGKTNSRAFPSPPIRHRIVLIISMPTSCVAVGCTNRQRKRLDVTFHRFPVASARRQKWLQAIKREGFSLVGHERICSEHFLTGKPNSDPAHVDFNPPKSSSNPTGMLLPHKIDLLLQAKEAAVCSSTTSTAAEGYGYPR